ncbi:MAG: SIR2 family protein [Rhodoplanes sp.]|uniref:SIR2 family protein n=1 Tax=Rhodoplanes sp. TaxID=1968906 RepID=UPI0017BF59F5|nr:SIR2 family protein [Rhodoplanes sp.]NVO13046.1 SIR2 family protein [Rhodoplanes sp.]
MEIDAIARLAQACFTSGPVVVLGSGASAPHGLPGMDALKDCLLEEVVPAGPEEEAAWLLVRTALANGDHLEQALVGKVLPHSLIKKIVASTWACINSKDRTLFFRAVQLQERFPVGDLMKALFQSNQKTVDVVTTNYDRAAEYACNSMEIVHSVGFLPGYIQSREGTAPISFHRSGKPLRTVRIWKVHGSLDWFERPDGTTVSGPFFELPASTLAPLIVTPGFNKYERTHDEPFRSAIQGADRALEGAEGYLCVGFGFRDFHIEPKMLERCRRKNIPIAVIARTLTDEAKAFLKGKAGSKYVGLEATSAGSRAYIAERPDGIDLPVRNLWSLDGFLKLVT